MRVEENDKFMTNSRVAIATKDLRIGQFMCLTVRVVSAVL